MSGRLRFNALVMNNASHATHGLWRRPDAAAHREFNELGHWVDLARTLEAGRFDAIFFADAVGSYDTYGGGWQTTAREGMQLPTNDPLVLVSALSAVTEHLGFAITSSVLVHPFTFARQISTLDHLTGGRAAWNIVTSFLENAARNFGHDGLTPHDERYVWAEEYAEVVYKLWEASWDDDALVRDVDAGVFADPDRIRAIDHVGERYRVEGPHQTSPSPQRTPVLFQAGSSEAGRAFAARHAEGSFIIAANPRAAGALIDDVRARARTNGRTSRDVTFFQGLSFVVGSTEEEARRKDAEIDEWQSDVGRLVHLSGHLQSDLAAMDLDRPLSELDNEATQGPLRALADRVPEELRASRTIRDLVGQLRDARFAGTPEQIADHLQEWADAGVDGINLVEVVRPHTFSEFVEHVGPVLQERGLLQREYAPGTLREKLFGGGARLPDTHPARRLRAIAR